MSHRRVKPSIYVFILHLAAILVVDLVWVFSFQSYTLMVIRLNGGSRESFLLAFLEIRQHFSFLRIFVLFDSGRTIAPL